MIGASSLVSPKEINEWTIQGFKVGDFLGNGKFGLVYKAVEIKSGIVVAMKILAKEVAKNYNMIKQLRREIEIHSRLKHKHILKMYGYFHDSEYVYQVLEYAPNNTLFAKLKKERTFSDEIVAKVIFPKYVQGKLGVQYIYQLTSAIGYLQCRNIIHRDLKLENILLDANNDLKISDFGWAVHTITDKRNTICGTIDYLAPEIINEESYDNSVDIWCIGILMYEMTYGFPPFASSNKEDTIQRIITKNLIFYDDIRIISKEAKDLMTKLIEYDKTKRITVEDILNHEYFKLYPCIKKTTSFLG